MKYAIVKVNIPNTKGIDLATEIYRPDASGKLPVVLFFHGFTGYKEEKGLVDLAHRLSEKGFVTVRFTASGFGDSGGVLEKDYRFTSHRKDAEVILRYVSNLSYIDRGRWGVYGHSMGGKLAVLFAHDHPEIKALCAVSAPTAFVDTMYGKLMNDWKKIGYFEKVSSRDGKIIRVPYAYVIDVDVPENDVLIAAKSVVKPYAFVMAGDADREVPWMETRKIYDALACPKQWKLLPGIAHKYRDNLKQMDMVHAAVVRFFLKWL